MVTALMANSSTLRIFPMLRRVQTLGSLSLTRRGMSSAPPRLLIMVMVVRVLRWEVARLVSKSRF